jgi:hypothetical protein
MFRNRALAVALVLALLLLPASAGKKPKFSLTALPDKNLVVADVQDPVAEQDCPNFAFAAEMESILRTQGVTTLDQRFWVEKLNGDLTCRPIPDYENLQRIVVGDYTVSANRHVRLTVRYTTALPTTTDELVVPIAQKRPFILLWRGVPHLVTGITWHEAYFQNGQRMVEITKFALTDPTGHKEEHAKVFDRDKDQTSDLGGMFDVTVSELDIDNWKR